MKEQNIAKAYAKSIIQLSDELKLPAVEELTTFTEALNANNHFETLLFSDAFTIAEKSSVLEEVFKRFSFSHITKNVVFFLLNEKRIGLFPLVFKELIVLDDHRKGFMRGVVEGTEDQLSDAVKEQLYGYLKKKVGMNTELKYVQNKKITAGYRVTVADLQLDASVDNQLDILKDSIINS